MSLQAEPERGKYGAKRQSFQSGYRAVAAKLLEDNPGVEIEDLADEFVDLLLKNKNRDALLSLAIYGLQDAKRSLYPSRIIVTPEPVRRERVAKKIETRIAVNLKNFIMPDGRRLGDYSGDDCTRLGGRWTALGKKIGPNGTVEKNATQADLKPFFKKP